MLVVLVSILARAVCGGVFANIPLTIDVEDSFELFIREYGRDYTTTYERLKRFHIFKRNVNEAIRKNEGVNDNIFGITQFMDLTRDEFTSTYGCWHKQQQYKDNDDLCKYNTDKDIPTVDAPESFDWRDHNAVTRIKDQGLCGSCWAFSTVGNVEAMYAIKYNKLIEFSEQQLVDCDTKSNGCVGGNMRLALSYLIKGGGAETEADYPYEEHTGSCHFNKSKVKVQVTGCNNYNLTSQEKLKQLLYQNGPLTIALDGANFSFYQKGILPARECKCEDLSHAVTLVGYGVENGTQYWIIKNCWGDGFGEKGYARIERGEGTNACGIMNDDGTNTAIL